MDLKSSEVSRGLPKRSSSFFLERRLSRLTISSRQLTETVEEDVKGALGLNLLYEPSETYLDLVFVHGLKGGSRKTWSKSANAAEFWPKEWLPSEPGFENVRIYSYGYNSDWTERKGNVLNVHDFGKGLLADLSNCPQLRRSEECPIILVGHSMGGLVMKKAYLLATRDPNFAQLAQRIQGMVFLGTPHRGADSARLLSRLLSATFGEKGYVQDLIPSSVLLQDINDDFRHVYSDLHVYSFYETVKTNLGYTKDLVVSKDSAVMGLPRERTHPLNADHRHVCKFSSPHDPNYIAVRNALAAIVEVAKQDWSSSQREEYRDQLKLISRYISTFDRQENELANINDIQLDGSCLWLTARLSFQGWQSSQSHDKVAGVPKIFWLSGKPGTGKSVMAGHVIRYLQSCNADCNYYFFRHDDKERSNVSALLRSLAYQMAEINPFARQELVSMAKDSEYFNISDEKSVWKALFLTRILRIKLRKPVYWIIDALDECTNYLSLIRFLSGIDDLVPLKIFITSRPLPLAERFFNQKTLGFTLESMTGEDTLDDIRHFLQESEDLLPVEDTDSRRVLIDHIVEKSNGSFLWASLVSKELSVTYSEQHINEVLAQVPSEIDSVYHLIMESIRSIPRNELLVKAIFRWVTFAARPLLVEELKEALKLDIGHVIPRLESVVGKITGYMVDVRADGKVQIVHETVRAFLTRQELEPEYAHSRLAEVCLTHLSGNELQPSQARRSGIKLPKSSERSIFTTYAALHFSYHLVQSRTIHSPLILLDQFFRTNVLVWVEFVARVGSLETLLQTSKNLKAYFELGTNSQSSIGKEFRNVQAWAEDLIRLVGVFGRSIAAVPDSVHFLVPPLCPVNSMVFKEFNDPRRSIKIVGALNEDWDDRVSCMLYNEGQPVSISCRESRLAIGMSTGNISLYRTTTFEETKTLHHYEPVRHISFANNEDLLASCGMKRLTLWDPQTGVQLWSIEVNNYVLDIHFDAEDTMVRIATRSNQTISYDVTTGSQLHASNFFDMNDQEDPSIINQRPPTQIAISSELNLFGVAFRNRPISFWDLEDDSWLSHFFKGDRGQYPGPLLLGLAINPNPELELAAASYQDGDLVIFNPFDGQQRAVIETSAHVLVSSPDGKTLATGDGNGMIQLFNFTTLQLLYRVSMYDYNIKTIAWTSDNLRFFDIRSNQCNVWEPTLLVRNEEYGDSSTELYNDEVQQPALVDYKPLSESLTITVICEHHSGNWIIAGRENGSVSAFDVQTGEEAYQIIKPMVIAVKLLAWSTATDILAVCDTASRFNVRSATVSSEDEWQVSKPSLSGKMNRPVRQMIFNPSGRLLLVSTDTLDEVWDVLDATLIGSRPRKDSKSWRWVNHPTSTGNVLLVEDGCAYLFAWEYFSQLSPPQGISLISDGRSEVILDYIAPSRNNRNLCIRFLKHPDKDFPELRLYPTSNINPKTDSTFPIAEYKTLTGQIKTVIGVYKTKLLFLDIHGWVCSLNIDSSGVELGYSRHFFIPFPWYNVGDLNFAVTCNGSVALARRDDVVIFHHGLDFFEEYVPFGSSHKGGDPRDKNEAPGAVKFSRRRRHGARVVRTDPGATSLFPDPWGQNDHGIL